MIYRLTNTNYAILQVYNYAQPNYFPHVTKLVDIQFLSLHQRVNWEHFYQESHQDIEAILPFLMNL